MDEGTALTKYVTLSKLSSDFLSLARQYGRTIISEMGVGGNAGKTVKEEGGMGGWAGGKKFVVRGILFKLCNDVQLSNGQWLYGGETCDIQSANKGQREHPHTPVTRSVSLHCWHH